jgi:type I restriction enzyme M protein
MGRTPKGKVKEPIGLFDSVEQLANPDEDLPRAFKNLYYHLYSNSRASRAETIIEDLTLLLFVKLSSDAVSLKSINSFMESRQTANQALVPLLKINYHEILGDDLRFSLDDTSLRGALDQLACLNLINAPAHVVGEAFQALIGPRLRGEKGQFFTAKSLVRCMIEILDPKPNESILDPACGTGGFLVESHIYQSTHYPGTVCAGSITGVDKDAGLSRLSAALLNILCPNRTHVCDFNSLDLKAWEHHLHITPENSFDVVLTNPPFGAKIGITDNEILKCYDLGHIWTFSKTTNTWKISNQVSSSEDPQVLFLEFCVKALKPGGRLAIVLPEGIFGNKNTSYIWDWLEEKGEIIALVDCPRTTFQPGTDTKTNVLFFRKIEKQLKHCRNVKIAIAVQCGHDRRGRITLVNGTRHPDDFPDIAASFADPQFNDIWQEVDLSGSRYLVPRYHFDRAKKSSIDKEITAGAKFVTLGDLVRKKIISIKKGHEVGSEAYGTGDIPFVRTSDISNFEVSSDPTKSVSEDIYGQYAKQQGLAPGNILMVVDGRYRIGTTAILSEHNSKCLVQSHLRIINVLRRDLLTPFELLFALNLQSVKIHMRNLVFIQSTLGTLGGRLLELEIPLLHGSGPWLETVSRFEKTLNQRAILLNDLASMSGKDFEL